MIDALPFAMLAAASFGALGVVIRVGLRRTPDVAAAAVIIIWTAAAVALLVALPSGMPGLHLGLAALLVLAGAVAPGVTQGMFVEAVRLTGPSRATLVANTFPIFAVAFAVAFLDEPLHAGAAAGTALIVLGAASLAWERSRPGDFPLAGIVIALACAVLFATRDNVMRHALRDEDLAGTDAAAVSLMAAAVVALVYFLVSSRGARVGHRLARAAPKFLLSGLVLALAYEGLVGALARGRVGIVAPLVATQSLWAIAFASLVLGRASERIGLRLVLAAALMAVGTALVGVYR